MFLSITTTHQPATDLGYLLHKNPQHLHSLSLPFGTAHVFYPEASETCCTAVLLLDIDPVGLVRKSGQEAFALKQYVNDRPYVASSFLSVAVNRVFRTLMSGRSKHRPELVETDLPLEITVSALPCRGGAALLERLFAPLGYALEAQRHALDPAFPAWGYSPYFTLTLRRTCRLKEFLEHLYVLMPVLDHDKHYYIDDQEIDKLLAHGKGWLATHPEKELIARRYLPFRSLSNEALAQLRVDDAAEVVDTVNADDTTPVSLQEEALEELLSLNEQRLRCVVDTLKQHNAKRVLDLGCGEGNLLKVLLEDGSFDNILGADVSLQALGRAKTRLKWDKRPEAQQKKMRLRQTALTYRDKQLSGYDAACVIEVIEHLDAPRLDAFARVVFEFAAPGVVILTTPNAEYNALFANLPAGAFRHPDHRFEWTRTEFETWAREKAQLFGYTVTFAPVGPLDEKLGAPTQMGVFVR